jgi:hypothetical protein
VPYFDYLINELTSQQLELLNNEKLDVHLEFKSNGSGDLAGPEISGEPRLSEEEQIQAKTEKFVLKQIWIVNQILNLSKSSLTFQNEELVKRILSYLAFHSFFNWGDAAKVDMSSGGVDGQSSLRRILVKNERVDSHLRETLLQFVGILLTKNEENANKTLIFVAKYIDDLLQKSSCQKTIQKSDQIHLDKKLANNQKELKATCSKIITLLTKISKSTIQIQKDGATTAAVTCNLDVMQTFLLTISIEFFRMFDSFNSSQQVIEDIEICFEQFLTDLSHDQNAKKNGKSVKNGLEDDEEPEWIEVLVEMLLNLFTINKNWIRNIVKNQFRKLFPKLTYNSVKLIVDLLEPEGESDLLVEDDEAASMNDDTKSDAEKNGETSADSGDEDDSSDESDSADDEAMIHKNDTNLDKALKKFNFLKNEQVEVEEEDDTEEEDEESGIESHTSSKVSDDPSATKAINAKPQQQQHKKAKLNNGTGSSTVATITEDSSDESADLDDDAMLKLDEALAQQFKLRKKDKQNATFVIQYKLRALDFIQELFKTTYRLDLITFLIKPMLNILFESQTKPNLKFISQRILGFLVNLKNTTRRIQNSKLPTVEELFELLVHIINCSTAHFNVLNTLVETSMYCVRLIQHMANICGNETEQDRILKKLTNTYMDIIKNDKSKVNPTMYKEYLIRYPGNSSSQLLIQMIDCITMADVKLHKKTTTLITLNQSIKPQMFSNMKAPESDNFIKKIFQLFEQMIRDLVKNEDLHIKFVDAFLNLLSRVLNLPKHLFKKEFNENLASQLSIFIKDSKVKQAYKSRFSNLIQICLRSLK